MLVLIVLGLSIRSMGERQIHDRSDSKVVTPASLPFNNTFCWLSGRESERSSQSNDVLRRFRRHASIPPARAIRRKQSAQPPPLL